MRVHELAKELGISSKDLTQKLGDIGVSVKSHMSQMDDKTVELIKKKLLVKKEEKKPAPAKTEKPAPAKAHPVRSKPPSPDVHRGTAAVVPQKVEGRLPAGQAGIPSVVKKLEIIKKISPV